MYRLQRYWYSINLIAILLWPLSLLFCVMVMARRLAYRWGILKSRRVAVPVIIVGNISVGGNGKTPLAIRLVEILREAGYRPGVVSRGYGGTAREWPQLVKPDSNPREVGDEPVLLARRCQCPVVVDPDRVAAVQTLLADHDCNVVIADDGLQHYRLARDIEIAVIDSTCLGNGACLPAGPLREPLSRLRSVDFVVGHDSSGHGKYVMTLVGERAVNLVDPYITCALTSFGSSLVHAVAGIGNPERFFNYLEARGIRIEQHAFLDHHNYEVADLDFDDQLPVLMTEKDAVKCRTLAQDRFWYVPVRAQLDPELERQLLIRLARLTGKPMGKAEFK